MKLNCGSRFQKIHRDRLMHQAPDDPSHADAHIDSEGREEISRIAACTQWFRVLSKYQEDRSSTETERAPGAEQRSSDSVSERRLSLHREFLSEFKSSQTKLQGRLRGILSRN